MAVVANVKLDEKLSNFEANTTIPEDTGTKTKFGMAEIAIEASEIVSRLEQVAEGLNDATYTQPIVFLGLEQKKPADVMHTIESFLNNDDSSNEINNPVLDDVGKLVTVSHAVASYIGGIDRARLKKISTRLTTDTSRWVSQLFGFLDCGVCYHDDQLDGLIRVTRMVLHYKYPRYVEDGALALTTAAPTIYSSIASPLGVVQHLCRQLGLPLSCVRPVPVNTLFGSQHTMDVSVLQRMLAEDVTAGRTPLIVIADVGAPITGHVDNVPRLQELCKAHNAWLHLRGHGLASLILPFQHNGHLPNIADSFTVPLGSWLGVVGLPMVTLYKLWDSGQLAKGRQVSTSRESTLPMIAGLSTDHQQRRVMALPLWCGLQALGREGIHARIRDAFLACERIWSTVDVYKHVRVLSQKPGGEGGTYTLADLISKTTNVSTLFEVTATSVVFQFIPEVNEGEILNRIPPYYDKLNSWLGQILQLDAPQVPLEICELETNGIAIRFCPFENVYGHQPSVEEIDAFVACLEQQLIILQATVQQKQHFMKLVEESPVLKLVEMPDWAGLGGVRYAPEVWEQLLTDQAKEELNNLNIALVDALRATDSAFSLGEGVDGLVCIRFGMLTAQSDVEELLNLVIRVGKTVEENSKVLDSMGEIVKKGIEAATLDLQKENEERLWQEGILRHVPVVGTLVNWWSPKNKETGVKGRSLNLTQGIVESTENIYRYHMQLQGGVTPTGTKSPPTPLVQTPVGDPGHSRSSSHTSAASSQGVVNTTTSSPTLPAHPNPVQEEETKQTDKVLQ